MNTTVVHGYLAPEADDVEAGLSRFIRLTESGLTVGLIVSKYAHMYSELRSSISAMENGMPVAKRRNALGLEQGNGVLHPAGHGSVSASLVI